MVVLINADSIQNQGIAQYTNLVYVIPTIALSSTTFAIIPDSFGHSSVGGFDENCLIGLSYAYLTYNGVTTTYSALFNMKTNPFSNIQNPPLGEIFFFQWNIICLLKCEAGTYLTAGDLCSNCLANCVQCQNGTECELCNSTYGLTANSSACGSCMAYMEACL